jgi:transglutaminase-like putative cysteine protease
MDFPALRPLRVSGPLALLALGLLLVSHPARAARAPAPARPFAVAPPAAWVQPLPLPADPPGGEGAQQKGSAGLRFSLVDLQSRVGAAGAEEHYAHFARTFLSEGGVAEGAQLHLGFDPSYQRLTIHGVWLVRGGERRSIFEPAEVKVIQQERALEAQLYDGSLTALLFLRDIRVGDTVEYAYTVSGSNPVFAGHFSHFVDVRYGEPVRHWRYRLLWPEGREFAMKVHGAQLEPSIQVRDGMREYVWAQEKLPALVVDDGVPGWHPVYPELQLSDHPSWEAVAAWALPLFTLAPGQDAGVDAEAARIRAAHPTQEARLLAALRFTQDQVRYVGLELGPNSHQPHPPAEVLARRFGDCKDKALLLVTLLSRLGIEAAPALVNTRLKHGVDRLLPTHSAFDHAIVRARLDGRTYWLDATRTFERGALSDLRPPDLRRALVVAPGTRALEVMPAPEAKEPTVVVDEHYVARERTGPAHLTVTTRYSGPDADRKRDELSTGDLEELSRSFLNYYARTDPDIRLERPLEVKDDPEANTVTFVERYVIDGFWRTKEHEFDADVVRQQLQVPEISRRTTPWAVRHPRHVQMSIRLEGPEPLKVKAEKRGVKGPATQVDWNLRTEKGVLRLDYRYQSLADSVAPEKMAEHLKAVREARESLGYRITLGSAGAAQTASEGLDWKAAAWLLGVLGITVGGLWVVHVGPANLWMQLRSRKRRKAFVSKFDETAGSTAATALPLATVQALPEALTRLRCRCGQRGGPVIPTPEPIFLGEQVILSLKWPCVGCGCERRAFYVLEDEQQAA